MRLENLEQHCHSQRMEDTNPASFVPNLSVGETCLRRVPISLALVFPLYIIIADTTIYGI
jgi:hypothetical protein